MGRPSRDEEREERIHGEIIIDAYSPEEQAMSCYYYLDDKLSYPFRAVCISERITSPLRAGDEVAVVAMAPEAECELAMFVLIRWEGGTLAVPLSQPDGVAVDEQTRQAIADWHYWVASGYEL